MKIYTRLEFMKLPEGTIFSKGKEWYFDQLMVKGKTLEPEDGYCGDFYCMEFQWVECRDNGESFSRLDEMLHKGASYPMNNSESRDGMFDPDDLFLVYEKEDLLTLKEYVEEAIAISN